MGQVGARPVKHIGISELEWSRGLLGRFHDSSEACASYEYWEGRAESYPGAEIRMLQVSDTLGGYYYYVLTNSAELAREKMWATPEQIMSRVSRSEDSNTIELLGGIYSDSQE